MLPPAQTAGKAFFDKPFETHTFRDEKECKSELSYYRVLYLAKKQLAASDSIIKSLILYLRYVSIITVYGDTTSRQRKAPVVHYS